MPYLPALHTDEETRGWIANTVLAETEVWAAELDGCIAGFASLTENMLEHLYVAPERQGKGVGGELLEQAKRLRPQGFRLWVFQRNREARGFYERRGLACVLLTDGADNEEREPDALYEWLAGAPLDA